MNVNDAAHLTVHDYPGGSESLAPRLGMSGAVLRNKVNPNNPRNMLTLAEADRMMRVTGDFRILQALAGEHDFTLGRSGPVDDECTIGTLSLDAASALGNLAQIIRKALNDGVISEREMLEIEAAGLISQRTVILLVQKLHAMAAVRPGRA